MINHLNTQYKGVLNFGSPLKQPATLVFDTGSNWLTVTSTLCDRLNGCLHPRYDPSASETSHKERNNPIV